MYRLLSILTAAALVASAVARHFHPNDLFKRATIKPIMDGQNFPDPSLIRTGDGWHAFATNAVVNGKVIHIQVANTPDFKTWTYRSGYDAMPVLADWIDKKSPRVWAPDVVQLPDGTFIMYYTAASAANTAIHCVSWASSQKVEGPYSGGPKDPWICPQAKGGAIDPAGYLDKDGTRWVVYKVDGNAIGNGGVCGNTVAPIVSTPIMLQQVSASDGHTLIGAAVQMITNGVQDGPVTEAPSLSFLDGKYVLFFSSNCFATTKYDVSYATAEKIRGPYTKFGPLFVTGDLGMSAPGGLDVAVNGDHAIWHGYVDISRHVEGGEKRGGCIGRRKKHHRGRKHNGSSGDTDNCGSAKGKGRAAYTAILSQHANLVKAGSLS